MKEMKGEHPDKAEVLATVKKIDRTIIEINHAKRAHQQQMNLGFFSPLFVPQFLLFFGYFFSHLQQNRLPNDQN